MNRIRRLLLLGSGAAALAPAAALARSAPMVSFENIAIATADGRTLTLEQVKRAVIQGANSLQDRRCLGEQALGKIKPPAGTINHPLTDVSPVTEGSIVSPRTFNAVVDGVDEHGVRASVTRS